MAKYKLQGPDDSTGVLDTEEGFNIPNAPGNRHWSEYQQWLLGNDINGNPLPGNPGVQVPDSQYTLTEYKENKIGELKETCTNDIQSGFESNATGTNFRYESTLKDQINISGAAQAGTTLDFTVIDTITGAKSRVSHTATQMNDVYVAGVSEMQTKKSYLYLKISEVNAAVNKPGVDAVIY